jgi:hypothetical protein
MKDSEDHTLREQAPTETQRNYGTLAAAVITLAAIGTVIYWVA